VLQGHVIAISAQSKAPAPAERDQQGRSDRGPLPTSGLPAVVTERPGGRNL